MINIKIVDECEAKVEIDEKFYIGVVVPNPVTLAPYRTFVEVKQPESKFVFRMRKSEEGPQAALFEADGGAWKIEAMQRVKEFLEDKLVGTGVKVIA